jgi:glycine/D-amino acid oxidase-like deaminating enzyme
MKSPSQQGQPHVVVVGAGAFGGWSALHLRRCGARVTLLDTWGPGNSRASSGDETRVIRSIYGPDEIYVELTRRAFELWPAFERERGISLYHRTGTLWMFDGDDSYARASLPHIAARGLRVDTLDPQDAARRFPQMDFAGVERAYYEHEAGYLLARRACEAVVDAFVEAGGVYRQIEARPGPVAAGRMQRLVLADGTQIEADLYLCCCGPWLATFFGDTLRGFVEATRQEVYYFGTPAGDGRFEEGRLPIWIDMTAGAFFYGIPGSERRGFKVGDDAPGPRFDPTDGDRVPSAQGIEAARQYIARRFPGLARAPLVEARVCQYELSPDRHYILDRHPEAANTWIVGAGSGHGFKVGPAMGELVARCVLEGEPPPAPFLLARGAPPHARPHRP